MPADKFKPIKIDKIEERKTQVSHIIAVCLNRNKGLLPEFEEIAAVAMAVQNMWLYLSNSNQYGGYWSTPEYTGGEVFKEFLKLKENEKCLGIFYVGSLHSEVHIPKGRRGDWRDKVKYYK